MLAHCRYSRTGEGLHRFVDPADKATYLYTQFEPADARRMFANFEQPDLKAEFAISAIAPRDWTVVSNGALLSVDPLGDGNARFEFAETKPISTYLTALVAGDYAHVDQTLHTPSGDVAAALYCRRSLAEHLDADRIFGITEIGLRRLRDATSRSPYPFGKYDQVFVPEYNGGAMENVGCVTLRDEYVFRSRATPASYQVRDDTILHELSHMWFGDLVTMRWWDDLWLKESFATWASNFALSQIVDDPESAWASFTQRVQDVGVPAGPAALDPPDRGRHGRPRGRRAELRRHHLLQGRLGAGPAGRLRRPGGLPRRLPPVLPAARVRQHLARPTCWPPCTRASGRDLSDWSAQWLETTGVNTLQPEIELDDSGTITSFAVRQSAAPDHPTLRAHRIAVGLYSPTADGALTRVGRIETDIAGERTEVPELVGLKQPDLLLVNDDDLTYAKVRLDPRSLRTVVESAGVAAECPGPRGAAGRRPGTCAVTVSWPRPTTSSWCCATVAVESDPVAVRTVLGQAASAARHYTPPDRRAEVLLRWQDGVAELMDAAAPGSDLQLALVKAFPNAAEDARGADRLAGWLTGDGVPAGVEIDHELRWSSVLNLARLGRLDEAAIDAEADRDNTVTGAEQAAAAEGGPADRGGEGRGLATGRGGRRHPERHPASDHPGASGNGARTRCWRRTSRST